MKKEIKAEDNAKAKKFINGTSNVADLFQSMGGFNLTNQFCVDKCKVAEGSVCGEDEAFCCIGGCKEYEGHEICSIGKLDNFKC